MNITKIQRKNQTIFAKVRKNHVYVLGKGYSVINSTFRSLSPTFTYFFYLSEFWAYFSKIETTF
jgi:hypothetical protein